MQIVIKYILAAICVMVIAVAVHVGVVVCLVGGVRDIVAEFNGPSREASILAAATAKIMFSVGALWIAYVALRTMVSTWKDGR